MDKPEIKPENILRPEEIVTETMARVGFCADGVEVLFPERREDFRKLIKMELGFVWKSTRWIRKLSYDTGTQHNLAARVCGTLLDNKFVVHCDDLSVLKSVVDRTYTPEYPRWIASRKVDNYGELFSVNWKGFDNKLYTAAKRVSGSFYNRDLKVVLIRPEHFEEVLDFANIYGFKLSEGAQKLVSKYQHIKNNSLVIKGCASPSEVSFTSDIKPKLLEIISEEEILDEFKD